MSRFFIALPIGLALLTGAAGCSGEQGATVAPANSPDAAGAATTDEAKAKLKNAGQSPIPKASPVL